MGQSGRKGSLFSCVAEDGTKRSIVASCEEDARRIFLFSHGSLPLHILDTGIEAPLGMTESLGRLAGPLVRQKPLLGDLNLALLPLAWLVLIQPLAARFIPGGFLDGLSTEALLSRRGFAGWFAFAAALLHYARIFLHLYVSIGDTRYGRHTRNLFFLAPLGGIFLGGALCFLPLGGGIDPGLAGLLGVAAVVWPWVFALRGGVRRLNESDAFRAALDRARRSPYAFSLIALLSAPAVVFGSDIARSFFMRWFALTLDAALAGNPPPLGRIALLAAFFLIYGLLVYGAFVASFEMAKRPQKRGKGLVRTGDLADSSVRQTAGDGQPRGVFPPGSLLRFLGGAFAWLLGLSFNLLVGRFLGL